MKQTQPAAAVKISADVPKFWEEMAMEETYTGSMEMISDEEDTSNGELDTAPAVEISADVPKVLEEILLEEGSVDPDVTD